MYNVIIKNVRCFSEEQFVPVKPITILIGENSSGKSTFLAATRIAWDLLQGKQNLDFNEEPFTLGLYDQIASYRGGKAGRAKGFTIGIHAEIEKSRKDQNGLVNVTVKGNFVSEGGKPVLSNWEFISEEYQAEITFESQKRLKVLLTTPSGKYDIDENEIPFLPFSFGIMELFSYFRFAFREKKSNNPSEGKRPTDEELLYLRELGRQISRAFDERPYAIAPIRTRPSVTYDPLKDIPTPEGTHIPILLAKISSTDKVKWSKLRESLDSFGKASGLFDDVEVRRMGQKEGDPFQVTIKISGPPFNLAYVGYGISQVLPILVDTLMASDGSTFLLQQPEVHLHPKAQAELGSFLAAVAKASNKNFIIETHSDYLLDRIRMDIRDKNFLSAGDVSILYFERSGGVVSIQPINIDENGNLLDVPIGYRQFFLQEERRMILGD